MLNENFIYKLVFFISINTMFAETKIISDGEFYAEIKRDEWGVPHIYGNRDSDVAFGLGYAHSQDDYITIQDITIASRGKLSEYYGVDLLSIRNIKNIILKKYENIENIFRFLNDYYVEMMNFWGEIDKAYEDQIPNEVKNLCDGYAAGLNYYAQENPKLVINDLLPFVGKDIIVGFAHRIPLFMGLDGQVRKLINKNSPKVNNEMQTDALLTPWSMKMVASNVFAVSPIRSKDGFTRLMINTHQPWTGPVSWYEAHVISNQGWDFYGGLFPGSPTPLIGHNKELGWSHTVNQPDLMDIYNLTINPKNSNQYWLDGGWEDIKTRDVTIKIKILGPFTFNYKLKIKESVHGPILNLNHGTYAFRIVTKNDYRFVEQWYKMTKSKDIQSFKNAMSIHSIPMFNTGYADKNGNLFYIYNAKIPKRNPGYKWDGIVPGETSTNIWNSFISIDSLPQITNPANGFYQNCNSSPFLATGDTLDIPSTLPVWTGIERHQTSRAIRALETYGSDSSITRKEFFDYKYDNQYSLFSQISRTRDRFILEMRDDTSKALRPALNLLANWNLKADSLNESAALAFMVLPMSFRDEDLKYNLREMKVQLEEAIVYLKNRFGTIQVPLGRVFRLVRGKRQFPLSGGPGLLRAIYSKKINGIYQAVAGDCYIQAIEWGPNGELNAWSVHQFGSATIDTESEHYDDQSILFQREEMKIIR